MLHSGTSGPTDPLAVFQYDLNFLTNTYKGGTQPLGNNTLDGRFLRDSGNYQACYLPNKAGLLVSVGSAGIRRTDAGIWLYPSVSILGLWGADLSNAAWTKTGINAVKNQVGADGVANTASSITATTANGVVKQVITSAVADRVMSAYVKRLSGTGTLEFSLDNEATWTVVPVTNAYTRPFIVQLGVTNPSIAFRIANSGDSFAVDFSMVSGAMNGQLLPYGYLVRSTGTAVGSFSRSTPWALNTDNSPLFTCITQPFAWYWQGRADRLGGGLFVSDGAFQVNIVADGTIQYGGKSSPTGQWKAGMSNLNKVAGWTNGAGIAKFSINGNPPTSTSTLLTPNGTHFVFSSNGSGGAAINGLVERAAFSPNYAPSDADLMAMTAP
ncbi:hypothetical protein [Mesorhizobium sp. SARCC-RB16n]|uniref:hypothetical protein n=1 Tax=Mesorhizobium sp. SARCC-RB16n TaxID=2116687 RepID=UPI00122F13C5|nr:hypothetical protein [Mesorhizobium sp. SARCC-RB16n]